ncbi:hypothetical protein METESE_11660 [Mesoterricola sediminis]|uniref:histidine kinase n=1 Tax=Mesoterricola sediminis TaxID=2927980 RepID=A0AA48KF89_9BACT|nr:hypothetical protein METESE_11660 [Mesoterricola sediminis]
MNPIGRGPRRGRFARLVRRFVRRALPDPSQPLERQFFQGLCWFAGGLSILVIAPLNNYPSLDPRVNPCILTYGVVCLGLAWLSRRGRHLQRTFALLTVVCLDALWFPNGGSQGSAGLYFSLVAVLIALFFRGWSRLAALGALLANVLGLLVLEGAHPTWAAPFPNPSDRLVDLGIGLLFSLPVGTFVVAVMLGLHERQAAEAQAMVRALQASEARFRSAFRNMPVALMIQAYPEGRIEAVNARFAQVFGRSAGEVTGRTPEDLALWADPQDAGRLAALLDAGPRVEAFEAQIRRGDGHFQWISLHAERFEQDGESRLLSSAVDITERRRLEAERLYLEDRRNRLRKAESLGMMAGSIAHHFNNKLQVALAGIEGLDGLPADAGAGRRLALARQALEEAVEVSQKMRISLGQVPAGRALAGWLPLGGALLEGSRNALPPGVTLVWEADGASAQVSVSEDLVRQVVANLVTNAAESLREGGGVVRARIGSCEPEDIPETHRYPLGWQPRAARYAYLEVADAGCGIDPGDLDRIFDPFYSTKFTGRGLGLSVTLGVVQAYGGLMTVESHPNEGSVFRAWFPCASAAAMAVDPAPSPEAPRPAGKILLVDDDEGLLATTQDLLAWLGYASLPARGGREAVAAFAAHPDQFVCVITDLTMPGLDGWQTLAALRERDPALPAIVMSGYHRGQGAGAPPRDLPHVFLGKPFRLAELKAALETALAFAETRV